MSALRWAAIGTGTISRSVVADLQSCEGAEVSIVHSRDAAKAERFAGEFGIPRFTDDLDSLLADDDIDAIYLATPIATHHALTRRAIESGKHVLVEKPIAQTAAEVGELFELAARHRVFLMEAMWMKFNPAFRRLRADVDEGLIGEPRNVRAGFGIPFPDDGASRWRPEGGGALLDQGIYPVTLALTYLGSPTSIAAVGRLRDDGNDLSEHMTLEFDDGRFAQIAIAMNEFVDCSAAVSGTRGWVVLPAPFWATTDLEVHAGHQQAIFGTPDVLALGQEGNGYVPMLREVIEAINAGRLQHPVHPAAETIAVFEVLDAIIAQVRATQTNHDVTTTDRTN